MKIILIKIKLKVSLIKKINLNKKIKVSNKLENNKNKIN